MNGTCDKKLCLLPPHKFQVDSAQAYLSHNRDSEYHSFQCDNRHYLSVLYSKHYFSIAARI